MRKNPRRIYLALDDVGVSLGYDADWRALLDRHGPRNGTGAALHQIVGYAFESVRWQAPGTVAKPKGRRKA